MMKHRLILMMKHRLILMMKHGLALMMKHRLAAIINHSWASMEWTSVYRGDPREIIMKCQEKWSSAFTTEKL